MGCEASTPPPCRRRASIGFFSASAPEREFRQKIEKSVQKICIEDKRVFIEPLFPELPLSSEAQCLLCSISHGFEKGYMPLLASNGCSGTYFLRDRFGDVVGVFKPRDEEYGAINNPRGKYEPPGDMKQVVEVGGGAEREVAAYLLDHGGFANVPLTLMVSCFQRYVDDASHVNDKVGSLQKYMKHKGSSDEFGCGCFSTRDVHKISVLDVRIANLDRHMANMLVSHDGKLIPIDHGYCLPTNANFEADCKFEWLEWPQAQSPYSIDVVQYIRDLEAEKDIALLKENRIDLMKSEITLKICTMLLKRGVEGGLTPYDIGRMMMRENEHAKSFLETLIEEAREAHGNDDSLLDNVLSMIDGKLFQELTNHPI